MHFLTELSCFAAYITDNNGVPLLADATPNKIANPFDYGAGFINPTHASGPGLIYDIDASDYQKLFNCMLGSDTNSSCIATHKSLFDLNLPSIAIPNLKSSETVSRTVTNVGQVDSVYKAFVEPPAGVDMLVKTYGVGVWQGYKLTVFQGELQGNTKDPRRLLI